MLGFDLEEGEELYISRGLTATRDTSRQDNGSHTENVQTAVRDIKTEHRTLLMPSTDSTRRSQLQAATHGLLPRLFQAEVP